MRIAHVTPYDLAIRGGVNASVVELVRRQGALGHDVDLIGGASSDRDDAPSWHRIESVVVKIPANGSVAPLALPIDADANREIARLLSERRYDVVVVHEPALPMSFAVLVNAHCATVGVVHAYSESNPFPPFLGSFVAMIASRPDRLIAVSTAAREHATRYLDVPYAIIPNGIDVPATIDRRPAAAEILFLGRPEPRKGLGVLLDAIALIRADLPGVRLVVAGDGTAEQWSRYRERAFELAIDDVASFRGRVSEREKHELFSRATAYCSPATGGESQGVVLLEAMARVTPVIASGIAGYRTVVTDGADGLLVKPGDPASLAAALRSIIAEPVVAARLGAAGRSTTERVYDWRVIVPRHLAEAMRLGAAAAA